MTDRRRGYVLRIVAWRGNGGRRFSVPAFVSWYDPDALSGDGRLGWLTDLNFAKVFPSEAAAVREVERAGPLYEQRPLAERYVVEVVEVMVSDGPGVWPRVEEVKR